MGPFWTHLEGAVHDILNVEKKESVMASMMKLCFADVRKIDKEADFEFKSVQAKLEIFTGCLMRL